MARLARLYLADHSHLALIEASSASDPLSELDTLLAARLALAQACKAASFKLEAYSLLPRAVWILGKPTNQLSIGRVVQSFTRFLAPALRARGFETSNVWQSRFRSTVMKAGAHTQQALLFVDTIAPRLIPGASVTDWPWSSALQRIGRSQQMTQENPLTVSDPQEFWAFGNTPFERQMRYLNALQDYSGQQAAPLENAVRRNWAYGDAEFLDLVQEKTGRRPAPLPRGRKPG